VGKYLLVFNALRNIAMVKVPKNKMTDIRTASGVKAQESPTS